MSATISPQRRAADLRAWIHQHAAKLRRALGWPHGELLLRRVNRLHVHLPAGTATVCGYVIELTGGGHVVVYRRHYVGHNLDAATQELERLVALVGEAAEAPAGGY